MTNMISYEYLAGLVDGDGCVGAFSTGKGGRRRAHLEVRMTCLTIIKALHDQFGGQFREQKTAENRKAYWTWRTTDNLARSLLKEIYPHSITKTEAIHSVLCG